VGNQQSNENVRTRKRIIYVEPKSKEGADLYHYEVVKKELHSSFARFYLSDYVTYKDGNYKHIDFSIDFDNAIRIFSLNELNAERVQIALEWLDLNYIRNYNSTKTFGIKEYWDVVGKTEPRCEKREVSESSSSNISELSDCLGGIGEMLEQRQNLIASIEQTHHATNHAWTKQTFWDMPPGWK